MASLLGAASAPRFSFGILADVQYGDKPDGTTEGRVQRYREAPKKLAAAIVQYNVHKASLSFVLTLGDIIDGNETDARTEEDFEVVMRELEQLEVEKAFHVIGNHCLALPRGVLLDRLALPGGYYSQKIHSGWRLVVLDSMDVSVRWPEGSAEREEAEGFLKAHPLSEDEPQMSTWNGGIGRAQRAWLLDELAAAERAAERVIVALHHPLVSGAAPATHLVWNHAEVEAILGASPATAVVFCGHFHPGGYTKVKHVHYVTIEAILEAPTGEVAFGVVHVYEDALEIVGSGTVTSRKLEFA